MEIARWRCVETPPGAIERPSQIAENAGFATSERTVAAALRARGEIDLLFPRDLDLSDWWWITEVEGQGWHDLRLPGLATIAEVFLGDELVLASRNMFRRHAARVRLDGPARIAICFRALQPVLAATKGRAKWRQRVVDDPRMRFIRTSLIGRTPGYAPKHRVVGPWRGASITAASDAPRVTFSTSLEDGDGVIACDVVEAREGDAFALACGGREVRGIADREGRAALRLRIEAPALWFPATHGAPALHEARLSLNGAVIAQRRLGFRSIAIDAGADGEGFGFIVNGVPVFARGACWTPPDLLSPGSDETGLRCALEAMRSAGMNMVRIPGVLAYESPAFYALCDELGLMVWQDFPFANLDYPAGDADFCAEVAAEAEDFLDSIGAAPSLVALCGGAEIAQQAAMLGLPRASWSNAIFDALLPEIAARRRPDVAYLPHTPWGGELPFTPDKGVVHYYGVSAYKRPLDDAVLARPAFASEWLGFNHVPDHDPELDADGVAQPVFGERFGQDTGAVWWFEGVRDHYLRALYGLDPQALRRDDAARYLEFSRAVTAEVATETIARWRRHGSPTRGALSLMLRDSFAPGAGWGLLDHAGRRKPVFHALGRAFRPVAAVLTDEGLNGARISLINETDTPVSARLSLRCLREGAQIVASGERDVTLAPRSSEAVAASDLLGGFFDVTWAYRFGPSSHDVVWARLEDRGGALIDESFLFPPGRAAALREGGLSAQLVEDDGGIALSLTARAFAQSVRIVAPGWEAGDAMFHLPPGVERRIRLTRPPGGPAQAAGEVRALGSAAVPFA